MRRRTVSAIETIGGEVDGTTVRLMKPRTGDSDLSELRRLPKVERLWLDYSWVNPKTIVSLYDLKDLKELHFTGTAAQDESVQALVKDLQAYFKELKVYPDVEKLPSSTPGAGASAAKAPLPSEATGPTSTHGAKESQAEPNATGATKPAPVSPARPKTTEESAEQQKKSLNGLDLQLVSWGDGSAVPASGKNLVVAGIDNKGLLHIRSFDANENKVTDTDETKLPAQAQAISTLKQQIRSLLPPHVLTSAEKARLISETKSIVGQTPRSPAPEDDVPPAPAAPTSRHAKTIDELDQDFRGACSATVPRPLGRGVLSGPHPPLIAGTWRYLCRERRLPRAKA